MSQPTYLPMAEYVPHSGRMVLLDRVLSATKNEIHTEVTIRTSSPFYESNRGSSAENGAVGAWIGIEYMAQTIAALAGWEARARDAAVQVGLLVGTRRYDCAVAAFPLGTVLTVTAQREFQADNGVAVMNCHIADQTGKTLAQAQLSVYQPDNLQAYLKQA